MPASRSLILSTLLAFGCSDANEGLHPSDSADTSELPDTLAPDTAKPPDAADTDTATPADTADTAAPSDTRDTREPDDTREPPLDADTAEADTPYVCPWEDLGQGLSGGRVSRVEFDPRVPGVAWSVSGGTLFRSVDDGLTWEDWASDISANLLAFPPDEAKDLILGGVGLSISRDVGRTFDPLALAGLDVTALMLDPAVPSRVWVGTNALGILRSDNDGETFAARNNGVGLVRVLSFAGFPDAPDLVLAGTVGLNDNLGANDKGTILRTTDGGRSWATVFTDARWVWDLEVCPTNPDRVFAAVRKGVQQSWDRGLTWQPIPSLAGLDVLEVEVQDDCDQLWISAYQKGIYHVTDAGATVTGPMTRGLDLQLIHLAGQLSAHPTDPGVLLLGSHAGVFRTDNGGLTWRRVPAARGLLVTRLAPSPTEPDRLYLTSWGGGLWSRTLSTPWERVAPLGADYLFGVARLSTTEESLLVGAQGPAWVTTTGAPGFAPVTGLANALDAAGLPDGSWLAATQVLGVLRSTDRGRTWAPSNAGLTPWPTSAGTFIDMRSLAPLDDSRVAAGTRGRGVALSDDGALTWRLIDNALAQDAVYRLVATDDALIALVEGKGLYRSPDRGETWQPLDLGSATADLRDLAFDPETGWLFAAQGRGPLIASRDGGDTWAPFASFCGDSEDFSALTFVGAGSERRVVGTLAGNRVLAHRLGPAR